MPAGDDGGAPRHAGTGRTREGRPIAAIQDGWAGDAVWHDGVAWVAWLACRDPEPDLLERITRDWPLRTGVTPDEWRRRIRDASFTVSLGRLGETGCETERELARPRHAPEGPSLAAVAGQAVPAVVWSELRDDGSVVLASIDGGAVEVVAESPGGVFGPRAAAAAGRLWVAWQQWPGAAGQAGRPAILAASRDVAARSGVRGAWSAPVVVSTPGQSAWAPALAAAPDGAVWCAWDAWTGGAYHVFARRATPDAGWGQPVQVSPAQPAPGDAYHLAPDIAVDGDSAWVLWSTSRRWGQVNHRFNHARGVHAAVVGPAAGGDLGVRPAPGEPVLGERGRLPVFSIPFLHSTEEEFITPLAPRVRVGPDGPVVFVRQFRTAEFKDFGWDLYAVAWGGADWRAPERVSSASGFPDTPYGVVSLPPSAGGEAGADGGARWLLAYHAGDYPRDRTSHPSKPVAGHRLVVEAVALARQGYRSPGALYYAVAEPAPQEAVAARGEPHPSSAAARAARSAGSAPAGSAVRTAAAGDARDARARITAGGRTYELQWGDLHRHSAYSKCMSANDGDPLDHWRWVRDVEGLDFYALTEHLEYMSYVEWRRIDDMAQRLAAGAGAGGPLALCGLELAIPPGHTNFFYADDAVADAVRIACLSTMGATLAELWPKLRATVPPAQVVAIRHHQGHRGDVAATYAPDYEPLAEVIQTRGEYPDWLQALWRQGFRVGVAGATDHSRGAPFLQGLTGVWLPPEERTRVGVLAALRARRTFATNGVRLHAFLSAAALEGGPALTLGDAGCIRGRPRLRVEAHGTRPIETVEFYRDAQLLHVAALPAAGSTDASVEYVDAERDTLPPGEHAYWAKVTQGPERNGVRPHRGVAYVSPIWVTAG